MALNLTPKEEAEEKELYAMLYPTEGIAIDSEGKAKNKKLQGLLDAKQEEEEEEEETSFSSPIAMGLLGAGASILRQSGWRDTPITLGEQLGYAIPAGMQAYYLTSRRMPRIRLPLRLQKLNVRKQRLKKKTGRHLLNILKQVVLAKIGFNFIQVCIIPTLKEHGQNYRLMYKEMKLLKERQKKLKKEGLRLKAC